MSDVTALQQRALEIAAAYEKLNAENSRQAWGSKEYALGFAGDVGDLVKLVMAKDGLRHIDDVDEKLAHELSDCLWSILVLADAYGINLEQAFMQNMDALQKRIAEKQ